MEEESVGYEFEAALKREDGSEEVIKVAKRLKQLRNRKDPSAGSDQMTLTTLMSESALSGSSQAKKPEETRMQTRIMLAQIG